MTALAFVDTLEAAARAMRDVPGAHLVSDNPLLAHDPRRPAPIANIDSLIDIEESFALGREALDVALDIDRQLRDPQSPDFGLSRPDIRLAGLTSRLLSSLLYRATAMAKALASGSYDAVHLYVVDEPRWEARVPLLAPRFGAPHRALAEHGFFTPLVVKFTPVPTTLPSTVNDTSIKDFGRRIAMLPAPLLAFRIRERLGLVRAAPASRLVVAGANEAIQETLPHLARAGIPFRHIAALMPAPAAIPNSFNEPAPVDDALALLMGAWLPAAINGAAPMLSALQAQAVTRVVLQHLTAGLEHLRREEKLITERVEKLFAGAPLKRVAAVNGLTGPRGAVTYGVCARAGVTVVDFEHGVTKGLSLLTSLRPETSEAQNADWFFTCADNAVRDFGDRLKDGLLKHCAIGLPDQTRNLLRPRLQRYLARRRLGLRHGEPVVMHVSTLPYQGNHRSGPGVPPETTVYKIDAALIADVYARLRSRVVFKQYPTQRFPHEPDYQHVHPHPSGVIFIKDEDLRYIRAAADVIVTMSPTSTLGWCVGTGAPLVWLDSKWITPLVSDEMRAAFRAAFLVIDLDDATWPEKLRLLLDRDLSDIRALWAERAVAREKLCRDAIVGPPGVTGARAAQAIHSILATA